MSLSLEPRSHLKPLERLAGQRITEVRADTDGGQPVLVTESGEALILIDWRQGKATWTPTEQAQRLYRNHRKNGRRRRKNHV